MKDNLKYPVFMIIAVFLYRINDAFSKFLLGFLSTFDLVTIRSLFTIALLPILLWKVGLKWQVFRSRYILIRNLFAAVALVLEVAALKTLSLASFVLVAHTAPIIANMLSSAILKEPAKTSVLLSCIAAFIGLVIICYDSTFRGAMSGFLYASLGAIFYALSILYTKKIPKIQDHNQIYAAYIVVLLLVSALGSLLESHVISVDRFWPSSAGALMSILFVALVHIVAFRLSITAVMNATLGILTLEYLGILFAMAIDYGVWETLPSLRGLCGGVLIVLSSAVPHVYRKIKRAGG